MFKLPLDSLTVDSFVVGMADAGPNTIGRDCTYEPVCPRDGVAIGVKTMEPGCTTPDLCPNGTVAIGPADTMAPGCTALVELCPMKATVPAV
jgi:hypothetical protein